MLCQVICDGEPLALHDDIEGVLFLNINSYMGGVDLWASGHSSPGSARTGKQSLCDGKLEVRVDLMLHLLSPFCNKLVGCSNLTESTSKLRRLYSHMCELPAAVLASNACQLLVCS